MFCKNCGTEVADNAKVCENCGQVLRKVIYCSACGHELSEQAVICPGCGAPTEKYQQNTQTQQPNIVINNANTNTNTNINNNRGSYAHKSKTVALLLAIFLGYFGVHRFYVGKAGTGIIWLFTGGMFGIGWLIDIIMIAVGSFRDKRGYKLA